jgi:hypothetical protein
MGEGKAWGRNHRREIKAKKEGVVESTTPSGIKY